jgi:hypothetical protein
VNRETAVSSDVSDRVYSKKFVNGSVMPVSACFDA